MKKIAITGLSGVIGSRLLSSLPRRAIILDLYNTNPSLRSYPRKVSSHHFDLLSPKKCLSILRATEPDTIIHMAAITHIDQCELYRKEGKKGRAWRINVDAVEAITQYCKESGARLVYLSTECVFDGKKGMYSENAKPNPINWYGETKAKAESTITNAKINAAILRSVVAFDTSVANKTIFGRFAEVLLSGEKLEVVDDLYFMPTYVDDITKTMALLAHGEDRGIFHIASPDKMTPYDFACMVAKRLGVDTSRVVRKSAIEFFGKKRASKRLHHSTLKTTQTEKILGIAGRSVESILL